MKFKKTLLTAGTFLATLFAVSTATADKKSLTKPMFSLSMSWAIPWMTAKKSKRFSS